MPAQNTRDSQKRAADTLDCAVIGAGASGLYAAWRIASQYRNSRVAIFESLGRIGGRVKTIRLDPIDFNADIGAMRYKESQVIVSSLVNHFRLKTYTHAFPTTLYYLRGRHVLPPPKPGTHQATDSSESTGALDESADAGAPSEPIKEFCAGPRPKVRPQTAYLPRTDEIGLDPDQLLNLAFRLALAKRIKLRAEMDSDRQALSRPPRTDRGTIEGKLRALGEKKDGKFVRDKLDHTYFSPVEWYLIKSYGEFDGTFMLHDIGLWDMVQSVLSPEAFAFARDGLGYQSILGNWNAAEHLEWFLADFADTSFKSIHGGMQKLIERLADDYSKLAAGSLGAQSKLGPINLEHRLESVTREADGTYFLRFKVPTKSTSRSAPKERLRTVRTARLLLALPKAALLDIKFVNFGTREGTTLSQEEILTTYLQGVTANSLIKAFVIFEDDWWWQRLDSTHRENIIKHGRISLNEAREVVGGKLLTDMPIRQIYFHSPSSPAWGDTARPSHKCTALMLYCDSRDAEYWSLLADRGDTAPFCRPCPVGNKIHDSHISDVLEAHGVPQRFINVIMRYLEGFVFDGLLPKDAVSKPVTAIFLDWSRPPYRGGWHAWNAGTRPWQDRGIIARPFGHDERVFIVGEAFSKEQGWIEGALRQTEFVLSSWLGVDEPSWAGFKEALRLRDEAYDCYIGKMEYALSTPPRGVTAADKR